MWEYQLLCNTTKGESTKELDAFERKKLFKDYDSHVENSVVIIKCLMNMMGKTSTCVEVSTSFNIMAPQKLTNTLFLLIPDIPVIFVNSFFKLHIKVS